MIVNRKKRTNPFVTTFSKVIAPILVAGFFLPFLHLSTSLHNHHYDVEKRQFLDIVEHDSERVSTRTAILEKGPSCRNQESNISHIYCLSANGLLSPHNTIAAVQIAQNSFILSSIQNALTGRSHFQRSILSIAPKQSPPMISLS